MKKQSLIIASVAVLFLSAAMVSCKKDQSVTSTPKPKTTTINDVIRPSFDSTGGQTGSGQTGSGQTGSGGTAYSYGQVDIAIGQLNWGYYYQNGYFDSSKTTKVQVNLPVGYDNTNTKVFMVGSNKASAEFWCSAPSVFMGTYINYPTGTYKVLVVSVVNGVYYDAIQQTTINNGTVNTVTISSLQQVSETDLVTAVNNL